MEKILDSFAIAGQIESFSVCDARKFALENEIHVDDIDIIATELWASYRDGDKTHAVIQVIKREADDTPWRLALYPSGEYYDSRSFDPLER